MAALLGMALFLPGCHQPPPTDPVTFQRSDPAPEDSSPSAQAGVSVTTSALTSSSSTAHGTFPFLADREIAVLASDPSPASQLAGSLVAEALSRAGRFESVTFFPHDRFPAPGSRAPDAWFFVGVQPGQNAGPGILKMYGGKDLFSSRSSSWNNNTPPGLQFSWQAELETSEDFFGIRFGGKAPGWLQTAADKMARKLSEDFDSWEKKAVAHGGYPDVFYPPFEAPPQWNFLSGQPPLIAQNALLSPCLAYWEVPLQGTPAGLFDSAIKELAADGLTVSSRDDDVPNARLTMVSPCRTRSVSIFLPSHLWETDPAEEAPRRKWIVKYEKVLTEAEQERLAMTLLDSPQSIHLLAPLADKLSRESAAAVYPAASAAVPAKAALRLLRTGHRGDLPIEELRKIFWRNFLDPNQESFDQLMRDTGTAPDEELLKEVKVWSPDILTAVGFFDADDLPNQPVPIADGAALVVFQKSQPGKLFWSRADTTPDGLAREKRQGQASMDVNGHGRGSSWQSMNIAPPATSFQDSLRLQGSADVIQLQWERDPASGQWSVLAKKETGE